MIYQVDNKDKKIFITMIFVRERGYWFLIFYVKFY
jgi:hypothetical protein